MDNQNKPPQGPRRPGSRGGVEYTPSGARPSAESGETKRVPNVHPTAAPPKRPSSTSTTRRSTSGGTKRKPAKRNASNAFAVFFIVTVVVGVVVCVVAFAIAFRTMRDGTAKKTPPPTVSEPNLSTPKPGTPTENMVISDDTTVSIAVIMAVNAGNKTLSLYDAGSNQNLSLVVESTVALKDKFGQNIVFAEFKEGDIVDLTLEKETGALLGVRQSAQAWVRTNVSKVKVDAEDREIVVGNERFTYGANLFARYRGAEFDIVGLDPAQVVTIRGFQDQLLCLEVVRSFGYIVVEENKNIVNGTVEIGVDTFPLEEMGKPFKVSEGTHRVTVAGSNIERFETEIIVAAGEESVVRLQDIQLKAGVMTITVDEPDTVVTLNGAVKSITEPFVLDYGDYTLRVTKDGFAPYEKEISFREATMEVSVTLDKIMQVKTFQVYSTPLGADVYVDNQYIGITPCSVTTEYGQHTILVRMADYEDLSVPITVSELMYNPDFTLTPQAGVLYEP